MVAEIKVEANSFKVGDELMFQGPTTGVISLLAESIEHQFQAVSEAPKNSFVGVKLSQKVRENDQVYLMLPVEELENVKQ
jgi:putative protease